LGNEQPNKLFLIDGFGAALSAFLLGVVMVELEGVFGIPGPTLYFLALFPCLFAIYDMYSYRSKRKNIGELLKGIAFMNIAYSILSLGLAMYHAEVITYFGWGYLLLEIMIVIALANIELKTARDLHPNF